MKSRNVVVSGLRTRRSKTPYGAEIVESQSGYKFRDQVSGVTSSLGDHKKPLPHSFEVVYASFLSGSLRYVNTTNAGYYGSYEGCLIGYSNLVDAYFPLELFPSNTYNNTLSKCYAELRGTIDLSVELAQLGETARMVKAITKVETYTRNFRSLRALVAGVAGIRLAYVYGIKPLVSTVYDCVDKVQRALDERLLVIKQRAGSPVYFASEVNLLSYMNAEYQDPIHLVSSKSNGHRCEIKLRYKPLNNMLGTWTSLNPVSIAWELLPYSFVVDWFLDVGNYVRNLETSLLYSNLFVDGYVSRLSFINYNMRNKNSLYYVGTGTGRNLCTYSASSSAKRIRFSRTVLTSSPTPEMPSFKANLGSARLLNAAALLGVLLHK